MSKLYKYKPTCAACMPAYTSPVSSIFLTSALAFELCVSPDPMYVSTYVCMCPAIHWPLLAARREHVKHHYHPAASSGGARHAGIPLKPMLAKICEGIPDAMRQLAGMAVLAEYKYDGQRAQVTLLKSMLLVAPGAR